MARLPTPFPTLIDLMGYVTGQGQRRASSIFINIRSDEVSRIFRIKH
jgi:hypothetical protein